MRRTNGRPPLLRMMQIGLIALAVLGVGTNGRTEPLHIWALYVSGLYNEYDDSYHVPCACQYLEINMTGLDPDACSGCMFYDTIKFHVPPDSGWEQVDACTFRKLVSDPGTYTCTVTGDNEGSGSCENTESETKTYTFVVDHPVWYPPDPLAADAITTDDADNKILPGGHVQCSIHATDTDTFGCNPGVKQPGSLVYVWSSSGGPQGYGYFSPNGGADASTTTWTAPAATGTYTLTCRVDDVDQLQSCECGARDDGYVERSVQIQVCRSVLQPLLSDVVPPPPGVDPLPPPPGLTARDAIMTGGVFNAVHQTTIVARVDPVVSGSVLFEIVGWASTGVNHHAMLSVYPSGPGVPSMSVPLDGSGQAQAILTSSDKDMETITVRATFEGQTSYIYIPQATGVHTVFECDPPSVPADGASVTSIRFRLVQDGPMIPVPGHTITFSIESIDDIDGLFVQGPPWPAGYGIVDPFPVVTDANGYATGTYYVGTLGGTVNIKAEDYHDQALEEVE